MPGFNECGIYDEACRNRTCDHPTNTSKRDACQSAGPHGIGKYDCKCPVIVPKGVQCRTMTSQRPCGNPQCVREECSGARKSAEVFSASLSSSESVSEGVDVPQSLYTLTGLSERDVRTLAQALTALRKASPVGMDYRHVDTLRARVVDLWLMGE